MKERTNLPRWNGKRWQLQVQRDGVRRSFYSSTPGKAGQREAQTKADAWLQTGVHNENARISALWELYLQDVKLTGGTSNYQQISKAGTNYILPILGRLKIGALTVGHMQDVLNRAYKQGCLRPGAKKRQGGPLSRKTLQGIRAAMAAFVKWARKHQYTTLYPEDLEIPKGARLKGRTILQPDALRTLFSVGTTLYRGNSVFDENIYAYRFLVATGLRPGELVGLRCGDIDKNRVNLSRAINRYGETTQGKNENALRSFELNQYALHAYLAQLVLLRRQGLSTKAADPLFPLRNQQSLYNHWRHYQESNGIPHTSLYELRHTFVSIAQSLPDDLLKPVVGHSQSIDTRGIYAHELNGQGDRTADALTGAFEKVIKHA